MSLYKKDRARSSFCIARQSHSRGEWSVLEADWTWQ
jgi:hypothetical protein